MGKDICHQSGEKIQLTSVQITCAITNLDGDDGNFNNLQYEFPWFSSTSVIFLTGIHKVIFDLPSETLHIVQFLQTLMLGFCPRRGGICVVHIIQVSGLLHIYDEWVIFDLQNMQTLDEN